MFIEHSWKKSQSSEGAKHMSIAQKCFAPTTGKKNGPRSFTKQCRLIGVLRVASWIVLVHAREIKKTK
jgi:hypothetical protein